MSAENFTGYVLAGGKSSRMGADKAFLRVGEKTFLENSIAIVQPLCREVKVVLNRLQTSFDDKILDSIPRIFDVYENRGALGGIHAALRDCASEFAVVLAVDLPFISLEALEKMCAIIAQENLFSAIVPRQTDGKLQPLCAIYRMKNCLPELDSFLKTDDSNKVHKFLEKVEPLIIESSQLSAKNNLLANINSPEDLEFFFAENANRNFSV